jgi:hypothetical protein
MYIWSWGADEHVTNFCFNIELIRQTYDERRVQLETKESDYEAYDSKSPGSQSTFPQELLTSTAGFMFGNGNDSDHDLES